LSGFMAHGRRLDWIVSVEIRALPPDLSHNATHQPPADRRQIPYANFDDWLVGRLHALLAERLSAAPMACPCIIETARHNRNGILRNQKLVWISRSTSSSDSHATQLQLDRYLYRRGRDPHDALCSEAAHTAHAGIATPLPQHEDRKACQEGRAQPKNVITRGEINWMICDDSSAPMRCQLE